MSVIVAGPIALDTIETPTEKREDLLGGAGAYAAISASYFSQVQLIGVIGTDFPQDKRAIFQHRNVDISGVDVVDGKTFRWSGRYLADVNQRQTVNLAPNVFDAYQAKLTAANKATRFALLANMAPEKQLAVLEQLHSEAFVVADSMDFWIQSARQELLELLQRIDLLVLNDSEARLFAETDNLLTAGHKLRGFGPHYVVIKKGEHGAMLFGDRHFFSTVAYPVPHVLDPTGAGDSFAGGIVGHIASLAKDSLDFADISRSVVCGTVMASFNCESFSADRLLTLTQEEIDTRFDEFRSYTAF